MTKLYQTNKTSQLLSLIFFVNVANDFGQNYSFESENYSSISKIKEQNFGTDVFNFRPTNQKTISKIINNFNVKTASGFDQNP